MHSQISRHTTVPQFQHCKFLGQNVERQSLARMEDHGSHAPPQKKSRNHISAKKCPQSDIFGFTSRNRTCLFRAWGNLTVKRNSRKKSRKNSQSNACNLPHTPKKIALSHRLFFLGYIPYLELRLVFKLSNVLDPRLSIRASGSPISCPIFPEPLLRGGDM